MHGFPTEPAASGSGNVGGKGCPQENQKDQMQTAHRESKDILFGSDVCLALEMRR